VSEPTDGMVWLNAEFFERVLLALDHLDILEKTVRNILVYGCDAAADIDKGTDGAWRDDGGDGGTDDE